MLLIILDIMLLIVPDIMLLIIPGLMLLIIGKQRDCFLGRNGRGGRWGRGGFCILDVNQHGNFNIKSSSGSVLIRIRIIIVFLNIPGVWVSGAVVYRKWLTAWLVSLRWRPRHWHWQTG